MTRNVFVEFLSHNSSHLSVELEGVRGGGEVVMETEVDYWGRGRGESVTS